VLGEFIVSLQRGIRDGEVFQIGAAREIDGQGSALPALAMAARQDKGHGGKAWSVTVEGFPEGGAQFCRPIVIEQAEKLHGEPSGGFTALEGGLKKGRAFRDQDGQATGGGGAESLAFLFPQGLVVSRLFDEFMPVIGAGMGSDFGGA